MNEERYKQYSNIFPFVGGVILFYGIVSLSLFLLNPFTILGSICLSSIGAYLLLSSSNNAKLWCYQAMPRCLQQLLYEKSVIELITSESITAKLLTLSIASTFLPIEETEQLKNSLPKELVVYKQKRLIDCMPRSVQQMLLPVTAASVHVPYDTTAVPVHASTDHVVEVDHRLMNVESEQFYTHLQRIGSNFLNRRVRHISYNVLQSLYSSNTLQSFIRSSIMMSISTIASVSLYMTMTMNQSSHWSLLRRYSFSLSRYLKQMQRYLAAMTLFREGSLDRFATDMDRKQLLGGAAAAACCVTSLMCGYYIFKQSRKHLTDAKETNHHHGAVDISSPTITILSAPAELWQASVQRIMMPKNQLAKCFSYPIGRIFRQTLQNGIGKLLLRMQRLFMAIDTHRLMKNTFVIINQIMYGVIMTSTASTPSYQMIQRTVFILTTTLTALVAHKLRTSYHNCRWLCPILARQLLDFFASLKINIYY